ncbi:sugar ABC transporter substrate-binding protein [Leadbettera azotonutricia]|uniref:Putative monosaccharide-transporting ATPase n=1 Tax=Leadbettera azotonutricia (strain ATCC BAA-888 / DSM 13862 / ZAS-9) TaxID=545695 RepID=F5Y9K1_LEAAZ|nr:sugar ABC transporter substrate-binding protein [Leadbettera azotonutricia]AEF81865.1 putative monosaccharide-transporting ATPase [Leadbettera azotonutricia ZAS-9]
MKKAFLCLLAGLLLAGMVSAGGQKAAGGSSGTIRVGATLQDLGNVYFVDIAKGLEDQAKKLGWQLTIADGKSDAQSQINSIENFITDGVNAIIIAPYDSAALVPYVARAKEKGIRVICVTQPVNGYDAWLGLPEKEYGLAGGTLAGKWIVDHFPKNAPVEVGIISYPEMETIIDRGEGLKEGILKLAPNAKIVNEQSAATPERGEQATSAMLQANPNIKVIACINDSGALGALNAVQAARKATDDFCIVGLDATEEAIARIKEGTVLRATVDIAPVQTGRDTIDLVARVLKDGPVTQPQIIGMVPVDASNIAKY